MKRETTTYKGFSIYPEMHYLKNLLPADKLVFATLYNLTSKGKNTLKSGLHIKIFVSILNQHSMAFGIEKRLTKKDLGIALYNLTRSGHVRRLDDVQSISTYGGKQKNTSRPNFAIDTEGHKAVKEAKLLMEEALAKKGMQPF